MRRTIFITLLLVVMLTGCKSNKISENEILINGEVYQMITKNDIEEIASQLKETVVGIDIIYGFEAVVIYKNIGSSGYNEYYKKDNEIIEGRKLIGMGSFTIDGNVIFSGGTASGDYPFSVVYILEDKLVGNNNVIRMEGTIGNKEIIITQRAHAIETVDVGSIISFSVLDSEGNEIDSED